MIGRAHDIVERLTAARRARRAAMRRNHPIMERQTAALLQEVELDLLPGIRDFPPRNILEDDDELVAADARRHGVLTVKDAAQDVRERDEQTVARLMAERIVDVLEMIEVSVENRDVDVTARFEAAQEFLHRRATAARAERVGVKERVGAAPALEDVRERKDEQDGHERQREDHALEPDGRAVALVVRNHREHEEEQQADGDRHGRQQAAIEASEAQMDAQALTKLSRHDVHLLVEVPVSSYLFLILVFIDWFVYYGLWIVFHSILRPR